jgi:ATP-dependent RNA helicase DeaD
MKSFQELGLSKALADSVQLIGFETPTPIQEKAIPLLLAGNRDFIGLAQTGTGKTAAFGLPLLELVDADERHTQALIIAPTRELCLQIVSDIEEFTEKFKPVNIAAVYGGASITEQIRKVKKGAQIIVATPGRLIDLIGRKAVNLATIQFVVLDEADEMLNMGFKEDIDEILSKTPDTKITWLFSATMPREVRAIANNYMTDPEELTVGDKHTGNINIDHQYVLVNERDKYPALKRMLDFNPEIFGLIFCRTRIDTQKVAEMLMKDGYNADALHGDLSQQQRDRVMMKFRQRSVQILVATDVAARGIDVEDITHVIHMNIPDEMEFYTHRSGRTARAGKKGVSIAMVNPKEQGKLRQIEKSLKTTFTRVMVPSGQEVCQKQLLALMHKVHEVKVNEDELAEFLPAIYEDLKDLDKEQLIKRFASLEFNRFLDYYRNAPDLNAGTKSESRGSDRYSTGDRYFINIGKMDDLDKSSLLEMLDECCQVKGSLVGKIDIKGAYSFFEVEPGHSDAIMNGMKGVEFDGRQVRVELSSDSRGDSGGRSSGKGRADKKSTGRYAGGRSDSRGGFKGRKDSRSRSERPRRY